MTAEKAPLYLASRGIYSAGNLLLPLDQQSSHSNRNGIQMSCSSDSLLFLYQVCLFRCLFFAHHSLNALRSFIASNLTGQQVIKHCIDVGQYLIWQGLGWNYMLRCRFDTRRRFLDRRTLRKTTKEMLTPCSPEIQSQYYRTNHTCGRSSSRHLLPIFEWRTKYVCAKRIKRNCSTNGRGKD